MLLMPSVNGWKGVSNSASAAPISTVVAFTVTRARINEVAAKLAEESNRHLHTLSIVTALFLPPTLVFGIFGMNTRDLPFADTPLGTFWSIGLGFAAAGLVYWWLRRWRGIR